MPDHDQCDGVVARAVAQHDEEAEGFALHVLYGEQVDDDLVIECVERRCSYRGLVIRALRGRAMTTGSD